MRKRAGIAGFAGYSGAELVRLLGGSLQLVSRPGQTSLLLIRLELCHDSGLDRQSLGAREGGGRRWRERATKQWPALGWIGSMNPARLPCVASARRLREPPSQHPLAQSSNALGTMRRPSSKGTSPRLQVGRVDPAACRDGKGWLRRLGARGSRRPKPPEARDPC